MCWILVDSCVTCTAKNTEGGKKSEMKIGVLRDENNNFFLFPRERKTKLFSFYESNENRHTRENSISEATMCSGRVES